MMKRRRSKKLRHQGRVHHTPCSRNHYNLCPLRTKIITVTLMTTEQDSGLPLPTSKNIKSETLQPPNPTSTTTAPITLGSYVKDSSSPGTARSPPHHDQRRRSSASDKTGNPVGAVMKSACMTGDFAMQNVALQMGLNLVSVEGSERIKSVKTWVLRCHGCFAYSSPLLPLPLRNMRLTCGKDYKEDGFEVLSFLWWRYTSPDEYIYQCKRASHSTSEKEHAMDQSWNKSIPPTCSAFPLCDGRVLTSVVFVTKTSRDECYTVVICSTPDPPR